MSAQTVITNAVAAEKRARELAQGFHAAACSRPENPALKTWAEAVDLILEVAAKRAGLISAKEVERRLAELNEQSQELEEQLREGLRSQHSAISDLDRIKAGLDVWLVQGRLDAWEWAEAEINNILARGDKRDGA